MNPPTDRRSLEHPTSDQPSIGDGGSPSPTTRTYPTTPSSRAVPAPTRTNAPRRQPAPSRGARAASDASGQLKKNVSDGNNDTSDSACIRIRGTETRIGSNCHHDREEVRQTSDDIVTDYQDAAGTCTYDGMSQPCALSHSASRAITLGFTGGLEIKVVKAELSISQETSVTIQVTCAAPANPATAKGTIAFVSNYNPRYTIDKSYVGGGVLAERSAEQSGKEGRGVHCETIPRTAV